MVIAYFTGVIIGAIMGYCFGREDGTRKKGERLFIQSD